jgi:hypothetical protein
MNLWVREGRDVGEPLKTFFSSTLVRRLAGDIARVHPDFRVRQFTNDACRGLDALELLHRGRHIAEALGSPCHRRILRRSPSSFSRSGLSMRPTS